MVASMVQVQEDRRRFLLNYVQVLKLCCVHFRLKLFAFLAPDPAEALTYATSSTCLRLILTSSYFSVSCHPTYLVWEPSAESGSSDYGAVH